MLILMQRVDESVVITCPDGTQIVVTMLSIDRNRARIGYAAPRNIVIDRQAVHDRKQAETDNVA